MPDPKEGTTTTFAAGGSVGEAVIGGAIQVGAADRALSTRELAWRRFKRHPLAMASSILLVLIALAGARSTDQARKPGMNAATGRAAPAVLTGWSG